MAQSAVSIASSCGPKWGKPMLDEVPQRPLSLVCGDGEPARTVAADRRQLHPVEIGADLRVDRVLRRLPRVGHAEGRRTARRGLAVGVIVVPGAAERVGAVHQNVEVPPLGPVEVLHAEGLAVAGPLVEVRSGEGERRRRQDVGDEPLGAQALDQVGRGVRGRLVHEHRTAHLLERLAVGVGADVAGAVPQLGGDVAHAREDEVQLLPVEGSCEPASAPTRRAPPPDSGAPRCCERAGRAGRRRSTGVRRTSGQCAVRRRVVRGEPGYPRVMTEQAHDDVAHHHADVSGGWLRAGVFGAMDGLVTNIALVAGVGGGGAGRTTIILTGMAGLVAGAFSMALGEFASIGTQNDAVAHEVGASSAPRSPASPTEEMAELADTYERMGLTRPTAEAVAREVHADPERAVKVHITQELGIDPDDQPSPWTAAVSSFVAFAVGGILPLISFLLGSSSLVLVPGHRRGRAVRGGRDHVPVHHAGVVASRAAAADVRRHRGRRDVSGRHGDRRQCGRLGGESATVVAARSSTRGGRG